MTFRYFKCKISYNNNNNNNKGDEVGKVRTERISSRLVKEVYALGYSTNDIARLFHASSGQIWKKLHKMGVNMQDKRPLVRVTDFTDDLLNELVENGVTFADLHAMELYKDNHGKKLSRQLRNDEILRLRSFQLSYADIASTLNCGVGTVSRVVNAEFKRKVEIKHETK